MLEGIERELMERRSDAILFYGDTNSTLAGALAASKLYVPVAHIEAGLRSCNRRMPEEVNRVLTEHVSDLLFCPSGLARGNLAREGIDWGVHVVGNVMYDAAIHYSRYLTPATADGPFAVAIIHRAGNTDDVARLAGLLAGLARCPIRLVLPLHPRTRKKIADSNLTVPDTVKVRDPIGYLETLSLLTGCAFVLTDSGRLQKEAYYMGRKCLCLCLCEETEWRELECIGGTHLVGTDPDVIAAGYDWIQEPVGTNERPYGAGNTGDLVVDVLLETL